MVPHTSTSYASVPTLIGNTMAGSSYPLCPDNTGITSSLLPHAYDASFPPLARSLLHSQVAPVDSIMTSSAPGAPWNSNDSLNAPNVGSCVTSYVVQHTGNSMPIFRTYKVLPPSSAHALAQSMQVPKTNHDREKLLEATNEEYIRTYHTPSQSVKMNFFRLTLMIWCTNLGHGSTKNPLLLV